MLSFKKKQKKVKVKDEEKFASNIPTNIGTKDLEIKMSIDPAVKLSPQHFKTRLTKRRVEVAEFLSEMKDKYKLIHWEFEALGGGQYFIVAEVEKK